MTLRDANQFMFCGLRYRILRRVGGDALACPRDKRQNPTLSTKDEAQLNCVALRPPLDYEVGWRAVKGRDERQKTAPLTALHATGSVMGWLRQLILHNPHIRNLQEWVY